MELNLKLQTATSEFTKLQSDYSKAVENRQRLDAQKSENEGVKKEFSTLTPENQVYKLIGPILMKQEQDEAKQNVEKRLEWIDGEIKRTETNLKSLEGKLEAKRLEIVHVQTQLKQQETTSAALPAAAAPLAAA
ncbi:tubulin-binding prefolding complex subunit YKE2 [Sporobolomyces koalae]|uniref:tubulin-binding prefolding complex subunit YKE2 n=1 Tax=Sporobolomyces koalae TaxID=500713 RepID=UPI00318294CD